MSPSIDLFIFSDALGWKLAEERRFMADLFPHRSACETLLGYSCTCDPSILTGTLPHENGHFSSFIYDPEHSPFGWAKWLGWIPDSIAARARVRNVVSRWSARAMGITGYFQLYSVPFRILPYLDYTEKRDIYLPGGINGGQEVIFTLWDRLGIPWTRSAWAAGDTANFAAMRNQLEEGKVRCAYLFSANLDAVMHAHTTHGPEVDRGFRQLEEWIRGLHEVASRRYSEVRFHLFSDHGMTDTIAKTPMMTDFEQLGLEFGRDYAAVWDSTMARFYFLREGVGERVSEWLARRTEGRILTDEDLRRYHCYFPDRRFGHLIYLLSPGTLFVPCHMSLRGVPAMHGFAPEDPTSAACWLTTHPVDPPKRIDQIFQVMKAAGERIADRK